MGTPVRGEHEIEQEGMDTDKKSWGGVRKAMHLEEGWLGVQKDKRPTELKKKKIQG